MNTEIELPDDIIFEFSVDFISHRVEVYKQVGDYFYCKTVDGDEVLIRSQIEERFGYNIVAYQIIKFNNNMVDRNYAKLIMEDVIEKAENHPVRLEYRSIGGELKPYVVAMNEGGYNNTAVDLISLLKWVNKNLPFLVEDVTNKVI